MDGLSIIGQGGLGDPGIQWSVVGTHDLDGDGRSDVLWRHDNGDHYVWLMDGTTIASHGAVASPGSDWTIEFH